jgi:hypothetical protein
MRKVALAASGEGPPSDFMSNMAICWFIRSSSERGLSAGWAEAERLAEGYMLLMKLL